MKHVRRSGTETEKDGKLRSVVEASRLNANGLLVHQMTMQLLNFRAGIRLVALLLACLATCAAETTSYPPTKFPDASGWGRNIQRTMRLLATSTAEKRNTVRILFYGQSITEQKWAKLVEEDLRRRFPHAELCDQRALWKAYLAENKLETKALLRDSVHLNAHGEWLMAECVKAYLRYDPTLGPSPAEDWVKTHEVGKDVKWADGRLRLEFEGSRVEAV